MGDHCRAALVENEVGSGRVQATFIAKSDRRGSQTTPLVFVQMGSCGSFSFV